MLIERLLGGEITDCPCGKVHRIPTREIRLAPRSLNDLRQVIERYFAAGPVLCVADANTWEAAGKRAAGMLRDSGRAVDVHFVDRHSQPAHADRQTVDELTEVVQNSRCAGLLAVGAGTINDIGKSAATASGCPQVTVATAASMNGYPSAISALSADGVKVTEPCTPPAAIIADPEVLATAPGAMNAAGFGDLLSKNASTADWIVAHILNGEYYCDFSASLAEEAVGRCIQKADAIRQRLPAGLTTLSEALMRSGISMVIAGSSAPASGGEHLISHLWDMTAHWRGRTPALHGAQTGVTTLVSLRLYEKLLALDTAAVQRHAAQKPESEAPPAFEDRMRRVFGDVAEAVLPFARQKYLNARGLQQRRRHMADRWEDIRRAVGPVLIAADRSRAHLEAAGAATCIADLGISSAELSFAYRHARWIRNRYTVLDLAAELGVLEEWQADVLGSASTDGDRIGLRRCSQK